MSDYDHVQESISKALEKTRADVVAMLPSYSKAEDAKKQLYESFNLLRFFSLPDAPEEGFNFDEDGNITHDLNKLARKEKIEIPRERIAKHKVDFQQIFERELKRESLDNNGETRFYYVSILIEQTQTYIEQHKKGITVDSWDKHLLIVAEKFIAWLQAIASSPKKSVAENINFPDLFSNKAQYDYILNLLVRQGFCQEKTFIWKDKRKGNKALLVSIIKYLHTLQYYHSKKTLSNAQILDIALHTFGLQLKIDTVKKATPDKFDLRFIPPANTLPTSQ